MRCADTADTYDTTSHPARRVHRPIPCSTLTAKEWCRNISARSKRKATCNTTNKNTKLANTLEHTTNKPQSAATAPCPCDANSENHDIKTNCLSQYGASYVLETQPVTHRAMWTHGGQMSAQNGPRSTTRILVTRLTSTWNFETQPFGQAPDFVMVMQNTPTHITKAEISRSETATRCMNAQKRNNAKLNAAASSMLLTHVETQSAPTGGRRHLTPCRVLEQSIAQPQPRQTEPPSSLTQEPHWSADQRQQQMLQLICVPTRVATAS